MLGSSNSIACANIMLNSAVAESLRIYADRLEKAEDFESALHEMIRKTIKDHKHIIFNGNCAFDRAHRRFTSYSSENIFARSSKATSIDA